MWLAVEASLGDTALGPRSDLTRNMVAFVPPDRHILVAQIIRFIEAGRNVVTIRGASGVGKSTMLDLLSEALQTRGFRSIRADAEHCEPRELHRQIRAALESSGTDDLDPDRLLESGRPVVAQGVVCVVLIDDADRCSERLLHYLFLMCSLLDREVKPLRVILAGALGRWAGLEAEHLKPYLASASAVIVPHFGIGDADRHLRNVLRAAGAYARRHIDRRARAEILEQAGGRPGEIVRLTHRRLSQERLSQQRRGGAGVHLSGSRADRFRRPLLYSVAAIAAVLGGLIFLTFRSDSPWGRPGSQLTFNRGDVTHIRP